MNIIEYWRKNCIEELFELSSFNSVWPTWQEKIRNRLPVTNANNVFNLGDSLYDIFQSTNQRNKKETTESEEQSSVSVGGTVWEALVCWYLNLCLIGRNTIVIRHSKSLLPECISDAITVQYNTNISNTESDLIALAFPDSDLLSLDIDALRLTGNDDKSIKLRNRSGKYNLKQVIDAITEQLFETVEIHIIQCKTNWNDNSQIPMLWDMVYSAQRFSRSITVGRNGRSINPNSFTYSFVTVPTVDPNKIKTTSICVKRVENLSGGNYWGRQSVSGVAKNIKEMLEHHLTGNNNRSVMATLGNELRRDDFAMAYSYFKL